MARAASRLVPGVALDALGEAPKRDRPLDDVRKHRGCDGGVVLEHRCLREPGSRIEHALGRRDADEMTTDVDLNGLATHRDVRPARRAPSAPACRPRAARTCTSA